MLVVVLEGDRTPLGSEIQHALGQLADLPLCVGGCAHVSNVHQHPDVHRHHEVDFRTDWQDEAGVLGSHPEIEQALVVLDRAGHRVAEHPLALLDGLLVDGSGPLVATDPVGIGRRWRDDDHRALTHRLGIDLVEGDIPHRLHVEGDVAMAGELGHTRPADALDGDSRLGVFERAEMSLA